MTETEFQKNMAGGKTLAELSEYPDNEFWAGYQRGCRRNYHGDKFGTSDEHKMWLSLANETDECRFYRGEGYRLGFTGIPVSEAMTALKTLAAKLSGKIGGSSKSEAKAAAVRENGKKGGRPRKVKPE